MNKGMMKRPMRKAKKGTMPRLLKFFFSSYKLPLVAVLICMLFNTLATVCPGIFQQNILENVDKANQEYTVWDRLMDKIKKED